jgi:hypothetical protein
LMVSPWTIQAPKLEPRITRYKHSYYESAAIKSMLPNKTRSVPRVNDCRLLNGIFLGVLRLLPN